MARVQAHAHMVIKLHALDDGGNLFERAAHFTAFACHGFKQKRGGLLGLEHGVQNLGNKLDACLGPLPNMRAGMDVEQLARRALHTRQIFGKRLESEASHVFLRCTGV